MEKEKETKFKIAVLQTKLELMEKIERREIITKQDIENKAFQGMKKHFRMTIQWRLQRSMESMKELI